MWVLFCGPSMCLSRLYNICRACVTAALLLRAVGTCSLSSSACRAQASSSTSARVAFAATRDCSSSASAACAAHRQCHRERRQPALVGMGADAVCPGTSSLSTSAHHAHLQALCRRFVGGLEGLADFVQAAPEARIASGIHGPSAIAVLRIVTARRARVNVGGAWRFSLLDGGEMV